MTDWHVPDDLVRSFALTPRAVDPVAAASVEQHIAACASCQDAVAACATSDPTSSWSSSGDELATLWSEVEDRIDQAAPGWTGAIGRWLAHHPTWRLVASTGGLRLGTLAAVAMVTATAATAARSLGSTGVFLALAPVVPVLLVAISFAPGSDPTGETGLATPLHGAGLLARRVLAVGVVAFTMLLIGATFVPAAGARTWGWVLPSLALSSITLAGGVRRPASHVAGASLAAWSAGVLLAIRLEPSHVLAASAMFEPPAQLVFGAVAVAAVLRLVADRRIAYQEVC